MTRLLLGLIFVLSTAAACADGARVTATGGWIREAPPTAPVRAGYISLHNGGDADVTVTGARSDGFGAIEIHEMVPAADGTMRMRPVPQIVVPAGAHVALEPGGLHLMLFRPARALATGERTPLVFILADGREIVTELEQR
jgi:copper(I)-binding protein